VTTEAASVEALFIRLLCDVMIPAELAEALRMQSYDVAEARVLSLDVQQDDETLLEEATRQDRAVVTCNYSDPQSNFCVIQDEWQSQGKEHAGIILVPQHQISSRSQRWQVRDRLLKFLNCYLADELRNQLWWLPQD
jgi:predicted nuclease of predicted toxin-antitoxin system